MKFFLPAADSPEQEERVLNAIADFTGFSIPSPRIYSLTFVHEGNIFTATVGERAPHNEAGPVIAILEQPKSRLFAVCTQDRGVIRGGPILVGQAAVRELVRFE